MAGGFETGGSGGSGGGRDDSLNGQIFGGLGVSGGVDSLFGETGGGGGSGGGGDGSGGGSGDKAGLTLVSISAQLKLLCPPYNPTELMN
jgi:hypothetical protein